MIQCLDIANKNKVQLLCAWSMNLGSCHLCMQENIHSRLRIAFILEENSLQLKLYSDCHGFKSSSPSSSFC